MRGFETWVARVLLLNSALTLGVSLGLLGAPQDAEARAVLFGVGLFGFLAAVLSLKRRRGGPWGGMLYYAVQLVGYFPHDGSWQFSVKAGVSIGLMMRFSNATLVLNMVALALLAATLAVLARRPRPADAR
ncbi:hypothetical protein SAMN05428959_106370 [Duganella sp. CF517]|uniref:hypothetical protein n=1 Tax=Duganella sp. CF517 TaxID=1881038 RepID=UPI0008D83E2D|nr:hypothetical protein [Duganella sp. CF517]SEO33482.1 hypothetical protein SAMN05428959_106370 [Duganella sp. CF517]